MSPNLDRRIVACPMFNVTTDTKLKSAVLRSTYPNACPIMVLSVHWWKARNEQTRRRHMVIHMYIDVRLWMV